VRNFRPAALLPDLRSKANIPRAVMAAQQRLSTARAQPRDKENRRRLWFLIVVLI